MDKFLGLFEQWFLHKIKPQNLRIVLVSINLGFDLRPFLLSAIKNNMANFDEGRVYLGFDFSTQQVQKIHIMLCVLIEIAFNWWTVQCMLTFQIGVSVSSSRSITDFLCWRMAVHWFKILHQSFWVPILFSSHYHDSFKLLYEARSNTQRPKQNCVLVWVVCIARPGHFLFKLIVLQRNWQLYFTLDLFWFWFFLVLVGYSD